MASENTKRLDALRDHARAAHNCDRKVGYRRARDAQEAAERWGGTYYYCARCGRWHHTTRGIKGVA